jgi:hypothetical protein
MTRPSGPMLTFSEAFRLPVSVDLRTAAQAFGMSLGTAYKLVDRGVFPCEVLRPGHRYRVPTASMMRALGIADLPVYAEDLEAGAEFATRFD